MSRHIKETIKSHRRKMAQTEDIKLRQHLNADALIKKVYTGFAGIRDHRTGTVNHTLADSLMAGFAMFSLKDPSLLVFDQRRFRSCQNLMSIYGMGSIPCDTSMREILDGVDPNNLRPLFKEAFRQLQRGKILEKFVFMEGCYLLNLDGTGYFSSDSRHSDACLEKKHRKSGKITYYLQTVGAAVVHPDHKEVIVLPPETIRKQDGEKKMDCERNAVRRFLGKLRQDHPHLQFIVNEDALSSNAPHIEDLEANNLHYILGAKPGDHQFLFQYVDDAVARGEGIEFTVTKQNTPHLTHCFRVVYNAPLNKSHQDTKVTFVEYWEENSKTGKTQHFTWVTDLTITEENIFHFMRGARARWKIENETFNTLKNQGYHFDHNFGLGKKHLTEVFVLLMMLAFLIDQILQLCCPLFQAACKSFKTRRLFWENVRSKFREFYIEDMEDLYRSLLVYNPVPLQY
ncbi:transposase [Desulforhopalus vacuolatus]|uniref:transposase n=1 Tax=Desulforhopalus vacuolatus TaxID=40414 RepID=UPI0019655812|nr:transposase [Desulforhopalus vacuolatus]MBM9521300.1 transposase [Desulforhopalus vacuolatus]